MNYQSAETLAERFRPKFLAYQQAFRELGAELETPSGDGFIWTIRCGGRSLSCTSDALPLNSASSWHLAKDKLAAYQILVREGVAVPRGFAHFRGDAPLSAETRSQPFFEKSKRVVVKPGKGDSGRGVKVCGSLHEVMAHTRTLLAEWDYCLIQEYIPPPEFRLAFLDDELLVAYEKKPPRVLGDGTTPLGELLGSRVSRACIADPSFIPACGEAVDVELSTSNLSCGCTPRILEEAPPDLLTLARRVHSLLGLRLSGIDIRQGEILTILEANGNPGFTHLGDSFPDLSANVTLRIASAIVADIKET